MYPSLFIILVFCVTTILGNASRISKCSKVICPAVKATICVKIKQKNDNRIPRYVMMSKCELKQINCFHDLITSVAAVKFCNATSLRQGGLINKHEDRTNVALIDKAADDNPANKAKKLYDSDDTTNESDESSEESGLDEPQRQKIAIPREASVDLSDDSLAPQSADGVTENTEIPVELTREPVTQEVKLQGEHEDNEAFKDNQVDCPQKCEMRDVMVCARCSHGIYRTFMSTCYMRMYQCQNPKEKLELVSRHACLGSGPYLGEMSRPSKNLVEPQDNDPVLSYIFTAHNSGD